MVAKAPHQEGINAALIVNEESPRRDEYGSIGSGEQVPQVKLYKRRYFMLLLFCMCTMLNGFQWIQFPIIASVLTCYYDVSATTINLTSILYMVMYLPFLIPVSWMMSVKGLRFTLIIGAFGNSLISCIQCVSIHQGHFYIVMLGQTVGAIAQVFICSMCSFIAAKWFGPKEVSTACAIAVYANQVGIALGFIIPPNQVPNVCEDRRGVRMGLFHLALWQAIVNTVIYLLIVLFFEDEPPLPPSLAEARKSPIPEDTIKSIKNLLKDRNFSMLMVSGGILTSVCLALSTMLNEMVTKIFPGKEILTGFMGGEAIVTGMFGALISGLVLDRFQLYWESSMVTYFLSLLIMITYTIFATVKLLWLHFLIFGLIGFFMLGYMPIYYEFAAEITYPAPEGTSAALLLAFMSLSGVIITLVGSWLQQSYSVLHSNLFFCACLTVGFSIGYFVKNEGKRSKHNESTTVQSQPQEAA